MATYGQLNQRNPSIDVDRIAELSALYEGGRPLERLYPTLIPRRDHEQASRYQTRLKEAQYRNYVGPIIDYFASMLFASDPVLRAREPGRPEDVDLGEFWSRFTDDCDRSGTDLGALFKAVLTRAMVAGFAWIRVHHPAEEHADNRADFERLGLGNCWLEALPNVLDWENGDDGRLAWAVVHRKETPRAGLGGSRDTIVETWDYLTRETVETYRVTYDRREPPQPEHEIGRIGEPVPHRFGAVPLICLDLPPALHVAGRLRSPQLAHFRKVCALAWSLSATAYAMPVAKVGNVEEFKKNIAGAGYELVINREDSWEWEAPPTGHFESLDTEIKAEKDEIFRIAHQMALGVENNAAAVGRSAESKASDLESTRVVLVAFSRAVKEAIEFALDLASRARGEPYEWSVGGLDDFAAVDVDAFIANLGALKTQVGSIPSRTFAIEANTRAADAMLRDLDEATKKKIRLEIEVGTPDPVTERKDEMEAASRMFGAPSNDSRKEIAS